MVWQHGDMKRFLTLCLVLCCHIALATPKPLPMDQAFQLTATARDAQTVLLDWQIAPGYYLYQKKFKIQALDQTQTVTLAAPIFPNTALRKTIPGLGTERVYKNPLRIIQPIITADGQSITLQVHYQGCSDAGFCYPPTAAVVTINLADNYFMPTKPLNIDVAPMAHQHPNTPTYTPLQHLNPQTRIEKLLSGDSTLSVILGFLVFGILIAFTPCVLPMIPILSSIIMGKGKLSHKHSFLLSLAYVLGMAITYAIAGILFGFIGSSVQAWFQQPWVIILFTLIFIAMALSLFGLYNLELPNSLRNRLAHLSDHQKPGTYLGVVVMGIFSTLVLSPCVTPPLVAVLAYISTTGSATLGGIALFSMGIGMGLPLLLIGAFGPTLLPHTGKWMGTVKTLMGILMLAVAIWMLSRIIPDQITLLLWAFLIITAGVILGALQSARGLGQHCKKAVALVIFVYGIVVAVSVFFGDRDAFNPFSKTAFRQQTLHWQHVKTLTDFHQQLSLPQHQQKPVILDFYADWCIACKELEHTVFADPTVRAALKGIVLLRADVTHNSVNDKALERNFNVVAPPTLLFFDRQHREVAHLRIVGMTDATAFLHSVKAIKKTENK